MAWANSQHAQIMATLRVGTYVSREHWDGDYYPIVHVTHEKIWLRTNSGNEVSYPRNAPWIVQPTKDMVRQWVT